MMNYDCPSSSKRLALLVLSLTLLCVVFVMTLGVVSFYHSHRLQTDHAAPYPVADWPSTPTVLLVFDHPVAAWVEDPRGEVEISGLLPADGQADEWQEAELKSTALMVGQRVRTGHHSEVLLRFSDGRQAQLEAGTEVAFRTIDESALVLILYRGQVNYGLAAIQD